MMKTTNAIVLGRRFLQQQRLSISSTPSLLSRRRFSMAPKALVTPSIIAGNPLNLLKDMCHKYRLCETDGYRSSGKYCEMQISVSTSSGGDAEPPILRTVNIQRISPLGIDFIMKQGTRAAHISTLPIAVCVTSGSYSPGEQVEQWRAEGRCSAIPLQEIIDVSPSSTIAQMIASTRAANEAAADEAQVGWRKICSKDRLVIQRKSRFVEMVQEARLELANGEISMDEIKEAVQAFRFEPERLEYMTGSPDQVCWDRWEWLRPAGRSINKDGSLAWDEPMHLLPY
uniref:Uncharacterized protein n=1 Tax=Corethron hystrix TaxID=216773 RepID=A0A7S1FZV2_9STRA|mmetsp:Transcript_41278/g.96800  ORF Transcript_41278/g.96800 Transcript_41278/m.96800 type:complete len:285 (+) Transcript_41278:301-1155(+)